MEGENIVPVTENNVIDSLEAVPGTTTAYKSYVLYKHADTGVIYYHDPKSQKTYSSSGGSPGSEVTDKAILDKLSPVPDTEQGELVYRTWQDVTDNNKRYYTLDGNTYFDDLNDPEGSKLSQEKLKELENKGQDFQEIELKVRVSTVYSKFKDKNSDAIYYTSDGGKTFVTKKDDGTWPLAPGISLDKVDSVHAQTERIKLATYETYFDPAANMPVYRNTATGQYVYDINDPAGTPFTGDTDSLNAVPEPAPHILGNYYMFTDNAKNFFYSTEADVQNQLGNNPPPTLYDSNGNKLTSNLPSHLDPVPYLERTVDIKQSYPDHYIIYYDPETNIKYYREPGTDTYIKNPGNPFTLDNYLTDEDIKKKLQPYSAAVRKEWFTKSLHPQAYTISTQEAAQSALEALNMAIVSKDKIRAHLGALQNRLENTVTTLNVQAENLQAAESRISDVDVATEMTNFVRNQILTQSATAMLGQANSMPNMMMSLISG